MENDYSLVVTKGLRYTSALLILFRILIAIPFENEIVFFFFFKKKGNLFSLINKYKIVPFEYKNYINFVRYSRFLNRSLS